MSHFTNNAINPQALTLMTNQANAQGQVAVKAVGLSKRYAEFEAVKDLNFEVCTGQTLALLGHNGAGKSTLIKMILGLVSPSAGQLFVQGQEVQAKRVNASLSLGYLPENVSFYDNMTAHELLSYFAKLKGVPPVRVSLLLEEFGLMAAKDKRLRTFSKGMRQRLGLAQAVLADPKVLLLDEPTVGLDPLASAFLYQKMAQLKAQGCAIIISTHELGLVQDQMDSALILGQGQMLASGDLHSLRAATSLPSLIELHHVTPLQYQQLLSQALFASLLEPSVADRVCLRVPDALKAKVIQQLQGFKIHEFSVVPPSLQDIFHFYMASLYPHGMPSSAAFGSAKNVKSELVA
ncbi:ABC transporter ATP-binding protein [Shewanella xiamenensis]|uniref:ABC transporter ATP-binding protein n=1 Tax=Shewanella xiamenensis TaxID=332186 RepID=UPI0024A7A2B9|nr:ABC transporter ATP-binding protein [Shewanella xiamenensis]MDI5877857.1 ABC transporter ATP-binding protein [Shewanella xiamenensis]